ncbi:hypothetical protein Dimus_034315 [Dionaea muscipula]
MASSPFSSNLLALVIFLFTLCSPTLALKKSFIVYMGFHSHGPNPTQEDAIRATNYHYDLLAPFVGSRDEAESAIFTSYNKHINGFAASIEEDVAAELAKHPEVISLMEDKMRQLHTTRTWEFMMLEDEHGHISHSSSLWKKAKFGEDIIIGSLDTGVWPESKSFSDEGYGPVPSRWKGKCVNGEGSFQVHCNRKLIGARYYSSGYESVNGNHLDDTEKSARDYEGHGTHTLSTAGGNFVHGASAFGIVNGTAKGGSPRARVAEYKVCWPSDIGGGCYESDMVAAFDQAIDDGVDLLSISIGGNPSDYKYDPLSIAAFHAVKHRIVVVLSAGNSGPAPGSVTNLAPWVITVAASTVDREVPTFVHLGNNKIFKGTSLSRPVQNVVSHPMISAADAKAENASANDAMLCVAGSLDRKKVEGKILVCLRGVTDRTDKGIQAWRAGAVGMVLCNDELNGEEIISDPHILPASHVTFKDGQQIFAYLNQTKEPRGLITNPKRVLGTKPAPFMASFSSQGPNTITPHILKPDITAPGVSILAAWSGASSPTDPMYDHRKIEYNMISGTSMSCPHVAGVVGLLKAVHPKWSPGAIHSAIMTTSRTRDNTVNPIKDGSLKKGNPFNYGAGHIRPSRAMDPGLVYDLNMHGYFNFMCAIGYNGTDIQGFKQSGAPYKCPESASLFDFNYPSFVAPDLNGTTTVTFTRILRNVGKPRTYRVKVRAPPSTSVSVSPDTLTFLKHGDKRRFKMTIKATGDAPAPATFGGLTWTDGHHYVRSPIVVFHTN